MIVVGIVSAFASALLLSFLAIRTTKRMEGIRNKFSYLHAQYRFGPEGISECDWLDVKITLTNSLDFWRYVRCFLAAFAGLTAGVGVGFCMMLCSEPFAIVWACVMGFACFVCWTGILSEYLLKPVYPPVGVMQ